MPFESDLVLPSAASPTTGIAQQPDRSVRGLLSQHVLRLLRVAWAGYGVECCEISIGYAACVGANLFARKRLIMRINSHLQTSQLLFLGLSVRIQGSGTGP